MINNTPSTSLNTLEPIISSHNHNSQICLNNSTKKSKKTKQDWISANSCHLTVTTQTNQLAETSGNTSSRRDKESGDGKKINKIKIKQGKSVFMSRRKCRMDESPASVCEWASWSLHQTPGEIGRAGNLPPFTKRRGTGGKKERKKGERKERGKIGKGSKLRPGQKRRTVQKGETVKSLPLVPAPVWGDEVQNKWNSNLRDRS